MRGWLGITAQQAQGSGLPIDRPLPSQMWGWRWLHLAKETPVE